MRRIFIPGPLTDPLTIQGDDAHHLLYSLRAKKGDRLTLVDGQNTIALMELTGFTRDSVTMRVVKRLEANTESPIRLVLAACLTKGEKFDFVVQKAVELGAAAIQPIASRNCVVRYEEKKAEAKEKRWQKIAGEAAKQCGRTLLPRVYPIRPLTDWLRENQQHWRGTETSAPDSALYFCYENENEKPIRQALREQPEDRRTYVALIGPEGGFTLDEAAAIEAAGGTSVTLGPRILRAETAALAALSILQYEKGDLGTTV